MFGCVSEYPMIVNIKGSKEASGHQLAHACRAS